jgi:dolichol-phosphate mannosyltransferase
MYDLAVVMPVYNEEACIRQVIQSWIDKLSSMGINYCILALNDGSKDRTAQEMEIFEADSHVQVIHKQNSGHGATLLVGYHQAVEIAEWVFQIDSDDEMKAEDFHLLWEHRNDYDALFGIRTGRVQDRQRKLISACSRAAVKMLFGAGVTDVNVPYRLIRASLLKKIVEQIPDDTLTPNLVISGAVSTAGARIFNGPVPHENRKTGTVSIMKLKLWKMVLRAFWQVLRCRPRVEAAGR